VTPRASAAAQMPGMGGLFPRFVLRLVAHIKVMSSTDAIKRNSKSSFFLNLFFARRRLGWGMAIIRGPIAAPEERWVCSRLVSVRRFKHLSQQELALAVEMTRDQLANVEMARTVLAFEAGWKICQHLDVDPLWLASGEGPTTPFHNLELGAPGPHAAESFRRTCLGALRVELESSRALNHGESPSDSPGKDSSAAVDFRAIVGLVEFYMVRVPPEARPLLMQHLSDSLRQFVESLGHGANRKAKARRDRAPTPGLLRKAAAIDKRIKALSEHFRSEREEAGKSTAK